MCGIVGYVGFRDCKHVILQGLLKLEYRGYDSAGFACIESKTGSLLVQKEAGGISPVQKLIETALYSGYIGVAHTRWATHGVVDLGNTHPIFNCKKTCVVVHNGIIEGHELLKNSLINDGHTFSSTTDTEVAVHLLSDFLLEFENLKDAIINLVKKLHGAFALTFLLKSHPDTLIVVRRRSPMVLGIGLQEMFVASDYAAFIEYTHKVIFMPDESFALIKKDSFDIYTFDGKAVEAAVSFIDPVAVVVDKKGFEHYMLKEIYEQKQAILRTISFLNLLGDNTDKMLQGKLKTPARYDLLWQRLGLNRENIIRLKSIHLIAAGSSWHAALIAQFFFESIAKISTYVHLASEFQDVPNLHMSTLHSTHSLYILVSQSGETADTLESLRIINNADLYTLVLTNVASSSMVREARYFLPLQAGPEISVASTKAFSTQTAALYWLANRLAFERNAITLEMIQESDEDLVIVTEVLESLIEFYKFRIIQELAPFYAQFDKFIFLGRHICYPFAMEAALKLREISYIFAMAFSAGELKHGSIALIDSQVPIVLFSSCDSLIYKKLLSNAQEVKARKGHLLVFAFEGQNELIHLADEAFIIPKVKPLLAPLAMTGLMQFFIYQVTQVLGRPIDKPRNLAKCVTVE